MATTGGVVSVADFEVEIYKDGTLISSPTLDFEIKRVGFFRAAVC